MNAFCSCPKENQNPESDLQDKFKSVGKIHFYMWGKNEVTKQKKTCYRIGQRIRAVRV